MNERPPPDDASADVLAAASGADVDAVERWARAGLLSPQDDGSYPFADIERARLIAYVERRGISADDISNATRAQGDLLGQFAAMIAPEPRSGYSPYEVGEAAGLSPERLRRLWVAAGLGDQIEAYDEDVQTLHWLAVVLEAGLPEDALLQLVRVYADALGRVAETETRLFHFYVHEQLRADGLDGEALTDATNALSERVAGLAEPALLYFHRKAFQRALREDLLLHLTEAVTPPGGAVGEMTAGILFVDLAGFTPLAESMGDTTAAGIIDRFSQIVREVLTRYTGKVVKQIGDEFMLAFTDPVDLVACGAEIADAVEREERFPSVRLGAHYGVLLYREGDYVGTTVNVAARVASAAGRKEFLITDALRAVARLPVDVEIVTVGPMPLKGISGEVVLHAVRRRGSPDVRVVDPVCHMALTPERAGVTARWHDTDLFFCSSDCAERFFARPEAFAT